MNKDKKVDAETSNEAIGPSVQAKPEELKTCFVIMPISDPKEYDPGHFGRVYRHIIKPACLKAGFKAVRADEVSGTNVIVIDILQKIINSDMAVCDLSSRNPNVLYELGIRQSFDLPVTLMKDDETERIFDIQSFRDVLYKKSLRYDEVMDAIDRLATSIQETYENKGKEVNSIIELMGITKAAIKDPVNLTGETEVLYNAIMDISQRMTRLEINNRSRSERTIINSFGSANPFENIDTPKVKISDGTWVGIGDHILHKGYGEGVITGIDFSISKKAPVLRFKIGNGGTATEDSDNPRLTSTFSFKPFE